jgi:hypothetical protein
VHAEGALAEVCRVLGFRECSVESAEMLTEWFAVDVAQAERRPDRPRGAIRKSIESVNETFQKLSEWKITPSAWPRRLVQHAGQV